MQPKPEFNSYSNNNSSSSSETKRKTATTTTTTTTTAANNRQQESIVLQQEQPTTSTKAGPSGTTTGTTTKLSAVYPRVIKSKQPLINFKFYLDIHDHQQTRFIEKQIKLLGGKQEFFLDASNVTHFITDKAELPAVVLNTITTLLTPQTPGTPPQTPHSLESNKNATITTTTPTTSANKYNCGTYKVAQTRADAILSRVRQQQQQQQTQQPTTVAIKTVEATTSGTTATTNYKIWQTEYALRFFKKVQHELRVYLQQDNKSIAHKQQQQLPRVETATSTATPTTTDIKLLKGNFIKIESLKRNRRPYYHLFSPLSIDWPKISLQSDDGAFSWSATQKLQQQQQLRRQQQKQHLLAMTRKSRSRATLATPTTTTRTPPTPTANTTTTTATTTTTLVEKSKCRQLKDTSEKQCGMCELCKIEYETLTIHLQTKDHEYFAKNSQNFIALDTLIQSSADVNKFLAEDMEHVVNVVDDRVASKGGIMEEMEVEVEEQDLTNMDVDAPDPLEQPLEANNLSPPLRERSKRSTKGKHSSEKFQNKRTRANKNNTTTTTTTTPIKSPPKTLEVTPTKNARRKLSTGTTTKAATTKNLSSPIRPFPPPSSLYKVVETSQIENTPKRGCAAGGGRTTTENVTASPSLIVKFKKVRNTQLMRLNGEAESFMFPKQQQQQQQTQRRASSDLPTDMDRQSSSERMRTSIYSSSSLDSSSISDIVVNMESPEPLEQEPQQQQRQTESLSTLTTTTTTTTTRNNRKKQSFPSTPIQPNVQMKRLRKPTTIFTPTKTVTRTPILKTTTTPAAVVRNAKKNISNSDIVVVAELSPPSAAAAIVAATANITLPAATRKSSRMATAIVSAATTSSRLLRAAAEEIKKSGKTAAATNSRRNSTATTTNSAKTKIVKKAKREDLEAAEDDEIEAETKTTTINTLTPNSRMRRCRFVAQRTATVVAMEDRMGESSASNTVDDDFEDDDDNVDDNDNDDEVVNTKLEEEKEKKIHEHEVKNETITRRTRMKTEMVAMEVDEDDEEYEVDNDDKADKDFKYSLNKRKTGKPLRRRGRRKKIQIKTKKKSNINKKRGKKLNNNNNNKIETVNSIKIQRKVTKPYYDYTKSERIQANNYAFERVPDTDLWYRVFLRQDDCREEYFEYYANTQYHKLPYELGPIPYTHTKVSGNCCKLCEPATVGAKVEESSLEKKQNKDVNIKIENNDECTEKATKTAATITTTTTTTTPYALKHKKLHLLQRYRQEQEALQQEQQQQQQKQEEQLKLKQQQQQAENLANEISNGLQCDILERAGSPHSTSSSCASSSTAIMQNLKKTTAFRNKLLNKAAFLSNLEMPPRKSPREHASTLALVSIIKQRQESKPNSDAEEANSVPSTPIPKEEAIPVIATLTSSAHNTRSAAGTPIEEMCFATEISENVKRMRRGRNKYDHSPPYVLNKPRRLPRPKLNKTIITSDEKPLEIIKPQQQPQPQKPEEQLENIVKAAPKSPFIIEEKRNKYFRLKHKFQQKKAITTKPKRTATATATTTASGFEGTLHSKMNNLEPSIRKTGQKKGVLEFAVDESAMKALDALLEPTKNVRQLERDIDDFLESTGKELDMDELPVFGNVEEVVEEKLEEKKIESSIKAQKSAHVQGVQEGELIATNTPPATDYFSSDFDLCDILLEAQNTLLGVEEAKKRSHESKHMSLYNTMALNRYFRKRKYMKTNRTGWPKIQKKKYSMRHQSRVGRNGEEAVKTVITPPDSEGDAAHIKQEEGLVDQTAADEVEEVDEEDEDGEDEEEEEEKMEKSAKQRQHLMQQDESDGDTFYDGAESIPEDEDGDTMAGSIVEDNDENEEEEEGADEEAENATKVNNIATANLDEYERAVEADDEEELNDALEAEIDENTMPDEASKRTIHDEQSQNENDEEDDQEEEDVYAIKTKRSRRTSSLGKALASCLNSLTNNKAEDALEEDTNSMTAATSTPTTNMVRALRSTPQLNGSLASCNSPTERAGDNSDIFTVSSDGLDTDLDISNPHANSKHDEQQQTPQKANNNNSKSNKYDITKYVKNPAANTCAAEAATAAAKSLAIAQFLKKEVRVTCRRIRAPFRRFRYRR